MAKQHTVTASDTIKSIAMQHLPKGASAADIEKATLALLEKNPQLDPHNPQDGLKLTLPQGNEPISERTNERYRVSQAMDRGEKNIPVSKEYVNEMLTKMEQTPTGKAVAFKIRESMDAGELKFVYKDAKEGGSVASFDGSEGIMYLDSRNYLGINDPTMRSGRLDSNNNFQTADNYNLGLIVHEGTHLITHQARKNGTLKGNDNAIAEETVAYKTQYDFVKELTAKPGETYFRPQAYANAETIPWNARVQAIEAESNALIKKYPDKEEREFEKSSTLRTGEEYAQKYDLFNKVKNDIKTGNTKGPLDYMREDEAAKDGSHSKTADFLHQRLPTYWGKDLQSPDVRKEYHQQVEKIVDDLKEKVNQPQNNASNRSTVSAADNRGQEENDNTRNVEVEPNSSPMMS